MLSSEALPALPRPQYDANLAIELVGLELSLDGFSPGNGDFAGHVRHTVAAFDGALLFDLPASGLLPDCQRIAVLRVPHGDASGRMATVFACLEADGRTIRIEQPSEATADLKDFAEAFVDVLQRIR